MARGSTGLYDGLEPHLKESSKPQSPMRSLRVSDVS